MAVERHGNGPGRGGPSRGYSWPPFQPGHELSLKHGAYASPARLAKDARTLELADEIRAAVPVSSISDEVTIQLLAITLRRVERAVAAVEAADTVAGENPLGPYVVEGAPALQRLREDLRGWVGQAAKLAGALGLTPASRARLGLDLVRGESVVVALQREARERDREREESA